MVMPNGNIRGTVNGYNPELVKVSASLCTGLIVAPVPCAMVDTNLRMQQSPVPGMPTKPYILPCALVFCGSS